MSVAALIISYPEVTRLCGYTVNPVFVGGTYRGSGDDRLQRQAIVTAHIMVAISTFIVMFLPIARYVFHPSHAIWGLGLQLMVWVGCTVGALGLALGCWRVFLRWQRRRLSNLFQLLLAIDQFNQLLQNLSVRSGDSLDSTLLISVLEIVRTHLLLGVQIDRLHRTGQDARLLIARLTYNWSQIDLLDLTIVIPEQAEAMEQALAILVVVNHCVDNRVIYGNITKTSAMRP